MRTRREKGDTRRGEKREIKWSELSSSKQARELNLNNEIEGGHKLKQIQSNLAEDFPMPRLKFPKYWEKLSNEDVLVSQERKKTKYTPLSKRKDRPDSILWLVKNFSQLTDGQIAKLVGSTKGTVSLIRKRTYWNLSSLNPKDPVILSLCSQIQFEKAVEKANRRVVREKKLKEKEAKALEKAKTEETKVEENNEQK